MGAYSKYVPIDATKKTGKKTSPMVDFIVSMALMFYLREKIHQKLKRLP